MISLLITDLGSHVTIVRRYLRLCDDPRATANSGGSRPSDNGGWGGDHPDPESRGQQSQKNFGPQFGLKIRGEQGPGSPPDPPMAKVLSMSAGQSKN